MVFCFLRCIIDTVVHMFVLWHDFAVITLFFYRNDVLQFDLDEIALICLWFWYAILNVVM